jgi:hypothetical protein
MVYVPRLIVSKVRCDIDENIFNKYNLVNTDIWIKITCIAGWESGRSTFGLEFKVEQGKCSELNVKHTYPQILDWRNATYEVIGNTVVRLLDLVALCEPDD